MFCVFNCFGDKKSNQSHSFHIYSSRGCLITDSEVAAIVEMSRSKAKLSARIDSGLVEVKSKVSRKH